MLVDVQTDDGIFLARVLREEDDAYVLKYMVVSNSKKNEYRYEDVETLVDKSCICGVYDPGDTERDAGFIQVGERYVPIEDEDEDYEPSESSDSEEDDDVSLVDSESGGDDEDY